MRKICTICKTEKDRSEFPSQRGNYVKEKCKPCHTAFNRERRIKWRKENPKKYQEHLDKKFIEYRLKRGLDPKRQRKPHRKFQGSINNGGYKEFRGQRFMSHPCCDKRGRILEHRMVMYDHLKRAPIGEETVHHKNGIRTDNRIENLELWTKNHGPGQRVEDVLNFCIEFLKKYGYEVIKKEDIRID
jgi:hypothetical protein